MGGGNIFSLLIILSDYVSWELVYVGWVLDKFSFQNFIYFLFIFQASIKCTKNKYK